MTNKTTKRALFTSVMSLIICVVMLMGTTFAWFTDSVASGKNKIVAGNLDVELYYQNDTVTDWKKVDADTNVFKADSLWEPGHTEIVKLKVVNEGTLALKYLLDLAVADEVGGVNVYEKAFKLSDYIEYGTTEDAVTSREDAIAKVSANATILGASSSMSASLASKEEKEFTLVVYMPETVGNEANYRGDAIPTIDFGIELLATQDTVEADSFDKLYDANAWTEVAQMPIADANGTVEVWTAQQLAGVMNNLGDIKTVKLMEDIDLAGRNWTPVTISNSNGKSLELIDGNGHSIKNMKAVNSNGYLGFIGKNYNKYTIKDLTFENAYVEGGSFVAAVIGYMYGNITMQNVDVVGCEISSVYNNKTKGIRAGGLVGFIPGDGGALTISDCDVTDSVISGYHNVGAMVGTDIKACAVVTNCSAKNNVIRYGSATVGGFTFGTSTSGYIENVITSGFTAENNTIVSVPADSSALSTVIANGATEITLGKDTVIEFPADLNNVKVINANGSSVAFTGKVKDDLTVNDAVITSDIKSGTHDLNFNGCTFTGDYGINYTYCDNAVFTDCVFDCAEKAIHFDVINSSLKVTNCEFKRGRVQIGGYTSNALFEGCTFGETASTSIWSEKGMRFYIPTVFTDCEFTNRVVLAGSNGLALTFEGCTMNGGDAVTNDIIKGGNVPTVTIK